MTEKRFTSKVVDWWHNVDKVRVVFENGEWIDADDCAKLLNALYEENKQLKKINHNLKDFRNFITEQDVLNEKQRKELQLQMLRLYNYFENYFEDTMSPNAFSEMWDNVKEDEKWEKR